jgi:hypothetical protein
MRPFSMFAAVSMLVMNAGLAASQDDARGIAFAQAPEQSTGVCIGGNPEKTLACARQKCVDGGAAAADCVRVAWCFPMGWSADIFIQHKEGIHWHEYLCGWDSKESVTAAAKVKCDTTLRDYIIECSVVRFWDRDGKELQAK